MAAARWPPTYLLIVIILLGALYSSIVPLVRRTEEFGWRRTRLGWVYRRKTMLWALVRHYHLEKQVNTIATVRSQAENAGSGTFFQQLRKSRQQLFLHMLAVFVTDVRA